MFESDVMFLKQHTDAFVLEAPDSLARVVVSPKLQARVMTSSAAGDRGESFGWINRELIASGKFQRHINPFGGEDRLWFGPEGGQFGVFFPPGAPFDLEHWQTPAPVDREPWGLTGRSSSEARFSKSFSLSNYSGTTFAIQADRIIRVLSGREASETFGIEIGADFDSVAFESENSLMNAGRQPWQREGGLLSIWVLGMFKHSPNTTVMLPFEQGPESELGRIVNDAYFGKPPPERLWMDPAGVVRFKADGAYRSKIGLSPRRAKPVMGSFDADRNVLTIVRFTKPYGAMDYVNSMWEIQEHPYAGDVSNSYNDGPPAPGRKPLGPFYELETSSPAAALMPGESMIHKHATLHIQGARAALELVARSLLGVAIE